jgi:histidinol-phosphate aminotransferase
MTPDGIERYIRPELKSFGGYSAATSPETLEGKTEAPPHGIIKLDANENPYGCSPRVNTALAAFSSFNIYTDNGQARLREQLARFTGVEASHIVAGGGSNQLIDLILRLFVGPGDEVVNCVPTFGIYSFSTELCAGKLISVPRDAHFGVDVRAVKSAVTKRTKVICLSNPNNPTGNTTRPEELLELLDTGIPLLLDEAYYEFSGETLAGLVGKRDNLMVLRTFSKWAGLAGLRVGYGLFPNRIAEYLLTIKMPYNVNVAALVAVEESLKDAAYLTSTVSRIIAERERLFAELNGLAWLRTYRSRANFILCELLEGDARALRQRLQDKGILVRYFDQPRLQNFIRISVGKPEHTDALMKALMETRSELQSGNVTRRKTGGR